MATAFATSAESIYSKPTPLLVTNVQCTPTATPLSSADPTKSMFNLARGIDVQELSKLLDSPKINIVDGVTGETFVSKVSLHMLELFCSIDTITHLLFASHKSNQISVPPSYTSKDGIIRVVRYMRRWCQNPNHRPTGELRTPPSIKEGISTSLACHLFNLNADARRMEKLVVEDFMGSPRFFITDEDVELIWCHYNGRLRNTPLGDALVWFVLDEVIAGTHALADEVRWMLEQEEYKDLKARVKEEIQRKDWRGMGRKTFLKMCQQVRERNSFVGDIEEADAVQGDPRPPRV